MTRALLILLNVIASLFLLAVVALLIVERTWIGSVPATPKDYFLYGSIGTELMPLPVFQILPDVFPDQFQPAGPEAGDWIDQFGFVRGKPEVNHGMPLGVSVSHYRPKSGAPSPVAFVGFNCAVCHTATIRRSDNDAGVVVYGMGNPNIDLVAFGDAIKTSILDEKRLTTKTIASTYKAKYGSEIKPLDRLMIFLWLNQVRPGLRAQLPMRNWPFGGKDLRNADLFPSGPGRNDAIKETVRALIGQTPMPDPGASKIPCLYNQERRHWAEFDGAIGDPITRNSLVALGLGASLYNLRIPGVLNTIRESYTYIRPLAGPTYSDIFRDPELAINQTMAARGREIYLQSCNSCHGSPGAASGNWITGRLQGQVIPASTLGTDSARVSFRWYGDMGDLTYNYFPAGHPLKPRRADLGPNPGDPQGYITAPLESAFSRAPYLHNGSVPTLAELINLKPRRSLFFKGATLYDPSDVGILVADHSDTKHYFRFDTHAYGNSNRGHDYPWAYKSAGWNEESLKDLLEYLKTL